MIKFGLPIEDKSKNILAEPVADYEKAEMDLLRNAMKHSYTERFYDDYADENGQNA